MAARSPTTPDRRARLKALLTGLDLVYTIPVLAGAVAFIALVFAYFGTL